VAPECQWLWNELGPWVATATLSLPDPRNALRDLKLFCMRRGGLSAAAWRYMLKVDQEWLAYVAHGYARGVVDLWCQTLNLLASTQQVTVSKRAFLDLSAAAILPFHRPRGFGRFLAHPRTWSEDARGMFVGMARAAFRESAHRVVDCPEFRDELGRVTRWFVSIFVDEQRPIRADANQRRANWEWYCRHADAFLWETERLPPLKLERVVWGSLVHQFHYHGCDVVPLTNAHDLYVESKTMDNCVYTYVGKCRGGRRRIFSLRREGKSTATVGLGRRRNRWEIVQVRGPSNAWPDRRDEGVAQEVCGRYNAAWRALLESGKVASAGYPGRRRAPPPPGYAGVRPATLGVVRVGAQE